MKISDICLIVQGPVISTEYGNTFINLEKLIALGFGQLVFSTWTNSSIEDIPAGIEVVLSNDPGSVSDGKNVSNVNRQIISVVNALDVVRMKYVLKIRSDSIIGSEWLEYLDLKEGEFAVSNITTKIPPRVNYLYHISDWVILAHTKDIQELFNTPLQDKAHIVPAEQYLWRQYSKRRFNGDTTDHFINLLENLHIYSYKKIAIKSLKKGYRRMPFGDNGINGILHCELAKSNMLLIHLNRAKEFLIYFTIQFYLWIRR